MSQELVQVDKHSLIIHIIMTTGAIKIVTELIGAKDVREFTEWLKENAEERYATLSNEEIEKLTQMFGIKAGTNNG
ncbi:MAG: hypothetical protein RM338_05615 [Nostoc sp. DedQUE12a]|nr:hypothetical protein [Nostoc sp. DedQUE12a]